MPDGHRNLNFFFSHNSFIGSFYEIEKIPNINLPEVCFIGRSNVGKSSIINAITRSNKLAKISKKPGKTKMINIRSKFNQFTFHLSNPLIIFIRNFFMKRLVKNKKFLESYLGKIYRN